MPIIIEKNLSILNIMELNLPHKCSSFTNFVSKNFIIYILFTILIKSYFKRHYLDYTSIIYKLFT